MLSKYYTMRVFTCCAGKIGLYILLLLGYSTSTSAQRVVVDSLLNELQLAVEDTSKVDILIELGWEHHNSNPQQTIEYGQRALEFSEAINYEAGRASALNVIGIGLDIKGQLEDAMSYYKAALEAAQKLGDKSRLCGYFNNIGLIHERQGNLNLAMEYYHKALHMIDEEKDLESAGIFLNNIGLIHARLSQYDKAQEYFERSLAIERQLDNKLGISTSLANIGNLYDERKDIKNAEIYYQQALEISETINDRMGIGNLLCSIGELRLKKGLVEVAADYFPRTIEIAEELGDKEMKAYALNCLGKVNLKMGKYNESIQASLQGLAIAQEMGAQDVIKETYGTLSESYAATGDFLRAYEYQRDFKAINDSIFNEQKSRQVIELATQYETRKKETENELLKELQAKNEVIIQRRTVVGWAVALILLLVTVISFILYKSNQQKHAYNQHLEEEVSYRTEELRDSNAKLTKSNKELERFAYIASHDLKEPLRNIMSFTRLIERRLPDEINPEILEYMSYVVNNTQQMHLLIEDVLEFSRVNSKLDELEVIDLNEVMGTVCGMLNSTLTERNVELDIGLLPKVYAHSSHLFLVFKNLIENGIKYNKSIQPKVGISYTSQGRLHQIVVEDNGIGIEPQFHDRIFGMFKRLHNRQEYQGSGLGLAICKKIINGYGGSIRIESEVNKGSRFILTLPTLECSSIADKVPEVTHSA